MSKANKPSYHATAVVTGAGSGIGRAFAMELAKRGGSVVCADVNLGSAQSTAAVIKQHGGKALAIKCDVTALTDVESLAKKSEQFFKGPATLVINNAGIGVGGSEVGEVSMDDWKATLDINLWGVIHGCHVFTPQLRKSGSGHVINVASTASFAAAPLMGPYNVSKAGVLALTETMAAELGGSGVGVTALCPTFVKTNIVANGRLEGDSQGLAQKVMDITGMAPEKVVKITLDGIDKNKLYVLPQIEARAIWRGKRLLPALYTKGAGLLTRLKPSSNSVNTTTPKLVVNK